MTMSFRKPVIYQSILGADGGGGGTPPAGTPPPGGNPPAGTPPAEFGALPEKWYEKLPEDLRGEGSLKLIHDIPSLAKSYVNAQKMVGAEKIAIPGKHATDDDWKNVYSKLGLPQKLEEYRLEAPKDVGFEEEFLKQFVEQAHKNGVLPKQAQGLLNWMGEATKAVEVKTAEKMKLDREAAIGSLQKEWGDAFKQKVAEANFALKKIGSPELAKFLEESGLGDNPLLVKAFASAASLLKEDKIVGEEAGSFGSALSPSEAQRKIEAITMDIKGPYYNPEHPKHKEAVAEMQSLYQYAYPST